MQRLSCPNCGAAIPERALSAKVVTCAGMEVRSSDSGDYVIRISAQGTFQVGWHDKTEWGGTLVDWTVHPALRKE